MKQRPQVQAQTMLLYCVHSEISLVKSRSDNLDNQVTHKHFPPVFPQTFADNPYFENKVLKKSYVFGEEEQKVEGTEIKWKPGKVRLALRAEPALLCRRIHGACSTVTAF